MKNVLILVFAIVTSFATAQNTWEAPLREQIKIARTTTNMEELKSAITIMERIALTNPNEWLPAYHAAYFHSQVFWRADKQDCKPCLKKMDEFLKIAEKADNNSEVLTLRANYWQGQIQLSSMMGAYYGPRATNLLEDAIKKDRNNPRAYLLKGQNIYYTPKMFGGGAAKAKPSIEKAKELLANEAFDIASLEPNWGVYLTKRMTKVLDIQ